MADLADKTQIAVANGAQVPCTPTVAQKPSKGEKVFDWVTYKGLNYWTNLLSSIAISDYFQNGKGRARLDRWINRVARVADAADIAHPSTVYKQSKVAVETATILSGGWLLLIPLKIMEDNKRPLVHWLNKHFGVEQKNADGKELSADEIYIEQEQPKQSWGRVLARRIFASGVVIGAGSALDHLAADKSKMQPFTYTFKGQQYKEQIPYGGKERATNAVVSSVNKGVRTITGNQNFGADATARSQRWMHFAVLDAVFTAVTASIMYLTNGAKKKDLPGEVKPCQKSADTSSSCAGKSASCKKFANGITPKEKPESKPETSYVGRIEQSQDLALAGQGI